VQNGVITAHDLLPPQAHPPRSGGGHTLADVVDNAERSAIESALRETDGNREKAAELLDISPTTLWRKMTRHGITFEAR
jgi:two-component system, NtrC family, response regulator HydG